MYVSFRFPTWERIFSNSTSESSLSVNAFETMLIMLFTCISIKVFCFSCLCIFLKRNFSINLRKIETLPKNTFNPCKTFREIVPMISSKFDKNPTLRRNIQNWKIKRQPKAKKFSKQWYVLFIVECLSFSSFSPLSILWISCSLYKLGFNWGTFTLLYILVDVLI